MQNQLIDHAARVLEHAPGRSMAADALYARISAEAGLDVGVKRLLECVRGDVDRFVVLPPSARVPDDPAWSTQDRSAYVEALVAAGLSAAPVVVLAERPAAGPDAAPPAGAGAAGVATVVAAPAAASAELLAELHAAMTELLRVSGDDAELCGLLSASMAHVNGGHHVDARQHGEL